MTINNKAGYIYGKHYTAYADVVKELKREKDFEKAESILLHIVEALKEEKKAEGPHWYIAPWYFTQLAIIYRKQKLYVKEKEILELFLKLNKIKKEGPYPFDDRLKKVDELIEKSKS